MPAQAEPDDRPLGSPDLQSHFPQPSKAEWLDTVRRTLRGRSVESVLTWRPTADLALPALVFSEAHSASAATSPEAVSPPLEPPVPWQLGYILSGPAGNYAAEARRAFQYGADDIQLWSAHPLEDLALSDQDRARLTRYNPSPEGSGSDSSIAVVRPGNLTGEQWRDVLIDGAMFTEIGATPPEALAWTLALLNQHLRSIKGVMTGPCRVRIALSPHTMLDVARMVATRRLLQHVLDAWSIAQPIHLQAVTSFRSQTAADPYSNLIRAATQGVSATLGGADSLVVRPHHPQDADAARWALSVGHLLREEGHLMGGAPSADAWWVQDAAEQLTTQAWSRFQAIEAEGGFGKAWSGQSGLPLLRSQHQRTVEAYSSGQAVLVGTTRFLAEPPEGLAPLPTPPDVPDRFEAGTVQHRVERVAEPFEAVRQRGLEGRTQRHLMPVLVLDLNPKQTAAARQLATDFFSMAGLRVQLTTSLAQEVLPERLRVVCVLGDHTADPIADTLAQLESWCPGLLRYVVCEPTALQADLQTHVDDCLHPGMNRLELVNDLHLSLGLV